MPNYPLHGSLDGYLADRIHNLTSESLAHGNSPERWRLEGRAEGHKFVRQWLSAKQPTEDVPLINELRSMLLDQLVHFERHAEQPGLTSRVKLDRIGRVEAFRDDLCAWLEAQIPGTPVAVRVKFSRLKCIVKEDGFVDGDDDVFVIVHDLTSLKNTVANPTNDGWQFNTGREYSNLLLWSGALASSATVRLRFLLAEQDEEAGTIRHLHNTIGALLDRTKECTEVGFAIDGDGNPTFHLHWNRVNRFLGWFDVTLLNDNGRLLAARWTGGGGDGYETKFESNSLGLRFKAASPVGPKGFHYTAMVQVVAGSTPVSLPDLDFGR